MILSMVFTFQIVAILVFLQHEPLHIFTRKLSVMDKLDSFILTYYEILKSSPKIFTPKEESLWLHNYCNGV